MHKELSFGRDSLKIIAYVAMLIDHIFYILYEAYFKSENYRFSFESIDDDPIYLIGRSIGRLTFIILSYLIGQGIIYSKNRIKYILRLVLLGIITEPIVHLQDLQIITDYKITISFTNAVFTLALGALAIYLYDKFYEKKVLRISAVILMMLLSYVLNTEFSMAGVFLVFASYKYRHNIFDLIIKGFIPYVILKNFMFLMHSNTLDISIKTMISCIFYVDYFGIIAYFFLYYYDPKKSGRLNKTACYLFYPVHLLIIYLLKFLIF